MMLAVWMALPGVWETNPSALHRGHFAVPSGLLGQSGLSLDRDLVRSAGSSGT